MIYLLHFVRILGPLQLPVGCVYLRNYCCYYHFKVYQLCLRNVNFCFITKKVYSESDLMFHCRRCLEKVPGSTGRMFFASRLPMFFDHPEFIFFSWHLRRLSCLASFVLWLPRHWSKSCLPIHRRWEYLPKHVEALQMLVLHPLHCHLPDFHPELYLPLDLKVKVLLFLPNFDIVDSPLC